MDADRIIEKIVSSTGLSKEEVEKKIEEKIKAFSGLLTREGAAYAVAKELGVDVDVERVGRKVKVRELKAGMEGVDLTVRVLRIFPPRRFTKDGRFGRYCRLVVGDETGTVRLTLWHRDVELVEKGEIERGSVLEILNAYVTQFGEFLSISVRHDGRILVKGDDPSLPMPEEVPVKVSDMTGDENVVDIFLKVLRVFPEQEVDTKEGKTKMKAFIGGDETGTVRVVLWGDHAEFPVKEGDVVKIEGGYAREGINGISLHVGRGGIIQKREGVDIRVKTAPTRVRIEELEEGDKYREVRGAVVQIYTQRPVSAVCNACGGKAKWEDGKWVCESCGSTDVRTTAVLAFELDDGTGTIRVVAFGEVAEKIYNTPHPTEETLETLGKTFLGKEIIVSGFVRRNEMFDRLELVAREIRDPDWEEEARAIIKVLEDQGK